MASSLRPTGTVTVGTSSSVSTDALPPVTAIDVVVAGAAVVVGVGEIVVVGARCASKETSACTSIKSSRNWMISTRSVSSSSSFVSKSPQPVEARTRVTRVVGRRIRLSMSAVFQSRGAYARRLSLFGR